jgi:hypothetical protein
MCLAQSSHTIRRSPPTNLGGLPTELSLQRLDAIVAEAPEATARDVSVTGRERSSFRIDDGDETLMARTSQTRAVPDRASQEVCCPQCKYDLGSWAMRNCPECGSVIKLEMSSPNRLAFSARECGYSLLAISIAMLMACIMFVLVQFKNVESHRRLDAAAKARFETQIAINTLVARQMTSASQHDAPPLLSGVGDINALSWRAFLRSTSEATLVALAVMTASCIGYLVMGLRVLHFVGRDVDREAQWSIRIACGGVSLLALVGMFCATVALLAS